jgi:hypothetical protein
MAKSKPQVKIVNCTTGEEIVRDANAEELAKIEAIQEMQLIIKAEAEAKAAEKQALLDRLGITADEAKLLLG